MHSNKNNTYNNTYNSKDITHFSIYKTHLLSLNEIKTKI